MINAAELYDLSGRVAIVTGGGTGIGRATARLFAAHGANVAIAARTQGDLEATAALIKEDCGASCLILPTDVKKEEQVVAMVARTLEELGGVDILVNNAGAAWGSPAEDHPIDAWDKVMNLNVRGYFLLSQAIAKKSMIARRKGRIINVASIAGLGGNPEGMNTLAYNTSKGAVINFTRTLGAEWGKYNITVNAICPGFFPSRMTAGTLKAMGEERLAAHAPLKRLGDDEDLKGLCLLYASDAGKHITGQWLAVDGGVSVVTGG